MSTELAGAPDVVVQAAPEAPPPRPRERLDGVRQSRWALVALAAVLLFGTWIRLVDLGKSDFWTDELYHIFAAEAIERGDGPRLPSGELYTRGIDITRLVHVARQYIADQETASRLPSAVFGIAGLVTFAAIAWRIAGAWPAVWAVLLLAFFPVTLQEARNTRFYTLQLLHGLVAFYAGWRVLRPGVASHARGSEGSASLRERWAWVALTLVAFLTAARLQPTTLSVAAGWAVGVLMFALADLHRLGRQAIRQSVAVQLTLAGIAGVVAILVARPGVVRAIIDLAMAVPLWAEGTYSPRMYYWMFTNFTPLLLSLVPLVFLVVARKSMALATYLGAWFAVPLVLHSFVFRFQTERYVIVALPALFLAAAIAAADGCGALFRLVSAEVRRAGPRVSPRVARFAAVCAVAVVAGFALFTTPAFSRSTRVARRQLEVRSNTDWKRALDVLRSTPGADTLPRSSFQHVAAAYYWRHLDFAVERGQLDRPVGGPETPGRRESVVHPEGTRDFYLGVPVLWRASAVREYFGTGRDVIVALDSTIRVNYPGGVFDELRRSGAKELCHGRCGTVLLYRWTLTPNDSAGGR